MLPKDFLESLYKKHISTEVFPPTSSVSRFITKVLLILFPEQTKRHYHSIEELHEAFNKLETELKSILLTMQQHLQEDAGSISKAFIKNLPNIYNSLTTDVEAILNGDPAAKSEFEIIRAYPGFL